MRGSGVHPLVCSCAQTGSKSIRCHAVLVGETDNGRFLELRRATVEYKYRLEAIKQDFEYTPQETENVGIGEGVALLILDSSKKVVEPDGRIYRDSLAAQHFKSGDLISGRWR